MKLGTWEPRNGSVVLVNQVRVRYGSRERLLHCCSLQWSAVSGYDERRYRPSAGVQQPPGGEGLGRKLGMRTIAARDMTTA